MTWRARHREEPFIPGWAFLVVTGLLAALGLMFALGLWH